MNCVVHKVKNTINKNSFFLFSFFVSTGSKIKVKKKATELVAIINSWGFAVLPKNKKTGQLIIDK
ncbi:uncharacterized protein METZ01_LOCUS321129 [marine metagenome]|uniref:Uncharacterized protein n=1 Tax=marine metagenome TaxID=408172 RepID=A0A382P6N7_9ZZZZ